MNNLNSEIELRQADGNSNTTVTRRFCIVFLDIDMLDEQLPFFVRTNFEDGFNEECFKSALKILMPAPNGV